MNINGFKMLVSEDVFIFENCVNLMIQMSGIAKAMKNAIYRAILFMI